MRSVLVTLNCSCVGPPGWRRCTRLSHHPHADIQVHEQDPLVLSTRCCSYVPPSLPLCGPRSRRGDLLEKGGEQQVGRAVLWKQEDGFRKGEQGRGFLANSVEVWMGRWDILTFSLAFL